MKKYLYIAAIVLVVVIPVYLYASPYITIYLIKHAVDNRDYGRLSQYVDYGELRKNLKDKADLVADIFTSNTGDDKSSGSIEKSLKKKLIEQAVEQLITPENTPILILQVIMDRERKPSPATAGHQGTTGNINSVEDYLRSAEFGYRSFNSFAIKIKSGEQWPTVFIMTRRGLQWKLTNIDI
jgi:hypothetical protein